MVLDSFCDNLHRLATYRFVSHDWHCKGGARRMQSRARSSYTEPQPTLAEHFPNALQRYNIFRALPNFEHRFGAIFSTNLPNWCFQHRRCSCSAKLMQAWLCTRLIASFERTVARACLACYRRDARISSPRIRNFRVCEITFRRQRSTISVWPQIMTEWQWQNDIKHHPTYLPLH